MRSTILRSVLALASASAAAVGMAQLPEGAAHWKSTIEVQGGGGGEGAGPMQSEIWMKGAGLRMQTRVLGMRQDFVRTGETVYQWTEGQKSGMKLRAATAARSGAPTDYAARISEYRTKGRRIGSETLDGHPCEIYELSSPLGPGRSRKETVWLAADLHNFPLQIVAEAEGSKFTVRNRDVSFSAAIPDALLAPPSDVLFRDLAEVMPKSQAPRH